MALSELLNSIEKKVSDVKAKKIAADDCLAASSKANSELAGAQGELEKLRAAVHEALGNVFAEPESRARVTK